MVKIAVHRIKEVGFFTLCGVSLSLMLAALYLSGCSSNGDATTAPVSPTAAPSQYFGPAMAGTQLGKQTYSIDHTSDTFIQYQYQLSTGNERYVYNSGSFTTLPNGILDIGITYGDGTAGNGTPAQGTLFTPPERGNWAVELQGQAGLVGILDQPFVPIVPNSMCPGLSTAESFQFITLPGSADNTGVAYGSVSVASAGSNINFTKITQFNIAGGTPTNLATATATGTCSPTFYGQTISVPDSVTVTDPGLGTTTPAATIAIGPSGFLIEDNGMYTPPTTSPTYDNILGAGAGAIGLPVPSAALSTSAVVGAQYNGFIYSTGAPSSNSIPAVAAASRIASFGFTDLQSSCPTPPAPSTTTLIYGGEFSNNDPSINTSGNCDFAVDLGAQDSSTNGLYPSATVYVGAAFPNNVNGTAYSFPAVAIAGQLQGKYAIFVIGFDAAGLQTISQGQQNQDWGIYLLQSN
jgi:hypothetical protein